MKKVLDALYSARWGVSQAIDYFNSHGKEGTLDHLDFAHDKITEAKAEIIVEDLGEQVFPDMKEKKGHSAVALIVGHTRKAPGALAASPIGTNEYMYWSEEAPKIEHAMQSKGIAVKTFFRDDIGIAGAYNDAKNWLKTHDEKVCSLIELHFNAFNEKVVGTETLHSDKNDARGVQERVFAQMIQDAMVKCYGRTGKENRGLRNRAKRGESGFINLVQVVNRPSVLIEPFFGDTPSEAQLAVNKSDALASALADAVVEFSKL